MSKNYGFLYAFFTKDDILQVSFEKFTIKKANQVFARKKALGDAMTDKIWSDNILRDVRKVRGILSANASYTKVPNCHTKYETELPIETIERHCRHAIGSYGSCRAPRTTFRA